MASYFDDGLRYSPSARKKPSRFPAEIVLSTAFTGVRFHPDRLKDADGDPARVPSGHLAKHMPITPREVARDAFAAYKEGSRFFHLHARNPKTARQSANPADYEACIDAIRDELWNQRVYISGPTSRKEDVDTAIKARMEELEMTDLPLEPIEVAQAELIRAIPAVKGGVDFLTIATEPDILTDEMIADFDNNPRTSAHARRWPETVRAYFNKLAALTIRNNIRHEVEIMHADMLNTLDKLTDDPGFRLGAVGGTLHAVVLLGFSRQLPIDEDVFRTTMERLTALQKKTGLDFTVSVGAVIMPKEAAQGSPRKHGEWLLDGHDYREVIEWVVEHNRNARAERLLPVDIFRTGLEDAPVMYGKQQTNASLVRMARRIFAEHNVGIVTDQNKANRILGVAPELSI